MDFEPREIFDSLIINEKGEKITKMVILVTCDDGNDDEKHLKM
jgi:hypothetical protein